jgi:hypothetical protein
MFPKTHANGKSPERFPDHLSLNKFLIAICRENIYLRDRNTAPRAIFIATYTTAHVFVVLRAKNFNTACMTNYFW